MRRCNRCGAELVLGQNWTETLKRSYRYNCIDCRRKDWRERRKLYYQKHPKRVIKSVTKWQSNNKDKTKEYNRRFCQSEAGKLSQKRRSKRYYNHHRKEILQKCKLNERAHHLRTRYNMTLEEFNKLYDAQNGKCALCRKPFVSRPVVDHSHKTGKVRGLLHYRCNSLLGLIEEGLSLETIKQYLI